MMHIVEVLPETNCRRFNGTWQDLSNKASFARYFVTLFPLQKECATWFSVKLITVKVEMKKSASASSSNIQFTTYFQWRRSLSLFWVARYRRCMLRHYQSGLLQAAFSFVWGCSKHLQSVIVRLFFFLTILQLQIINLAIVSFDCSLFKSLFRMGSFRLK